MLNPWKNNGTIKKQDSKKKYLSIKPERPIVAIKCRGNRFDILKSAAQEEYRNITVCTSSKTN